MKKEKIIKNAVVISGKLIGITGKVDITDGPGYRMGNCMFYPDNMNPVYRICLGIDEVKIIE